MIARIWRGRVRSNQADEYVDYVNETGIRSQRATAGNVGSMVLRRDLGDETEILVVSLWESMEAVRAFAGDRSDVAVYYPQDTEYLLELEPKVTHYEVPVADCQRGAELAGG
jgi:heme-degrading monooxygenase HmoA